MTERTIASLCQRSHEISRSKGWYGGHETDQRSIQLVTLLMQSELIEALEEWRDHKPLNKIYYSYMDGAARCFTDVRPSGDDVADYKPEGIPVELADCVIRVAQRCGSDGYDATPILQRGVPWAPDFVSALTDAMLALSRAATAPEDKPEEFHSFLAYAWAAIFAFCKHNKIDIWAAIEEKEAYNRTRPQRHGGKKA